MIKRLAGCIRQYKRDTVLTPLFMLGEVSCFSPPSSSITFKPAAR